MKDQLAVSLDCHFESGSQWPTNDSHFSLTPQGGSRVSKNPSRCTLEHTTGHTCYGVACSVSFRSADTVSAGTKLLLRTAR